MAIQPNEARDLIEQTFNEFTRFLERNVGLLRDSRTPYTLTSLLWDLGDWKDTARPEIRDYLFKDLSAEGYNYLLEQCFELADIYQLSTRDKLAGARVEDNAVPTAQRNMSPLAELAASGKWAAGKAKHGWINNGDGTFTAKQGATLWVLYGSRWREESGYEGDPATLQVGTVVGRNNALIEQFDSGLGFEIKNTLGAEFHSKVRDFFVQNMAYPARRTSAEEITWFLDTVISGFVEAERNQAEKSQEPATPARRQVVWGQLGRGIIRTGGGVLLTVAGVAGKIPTKGLSTFATIWGYREVMDGIVQIGLALGGVEYSGMLPTITGEIAEGFGIVGETGRSRIEAGVGLAGSLIGLRFPAEKLGMLLTVADIGISGVDFVQALNLINFGNAARPSGKPTLGETLELYGRYLQWRSAGTPESDWIAGYLKDRLLLDLDMIINDPDAPDYAQNYAIKIRNRLTGIN
ncbi:MAG: hypothetical protein FWC64_13005 [Treponema sp.]|nr:hypothetical protein [Treponema sp.]